MPSPADSPVNPADPPPAKQVICIKWGTIYGPRDVNILYAMLARHTTPPFTLHCFTDDAAGIRPEVACHALPELGCEIPPGTLGKWRKQALWGRELPDGVKGVALFVDLDSVIVGNMDDYFTFGSPDDVLVARNWARPLSGLGQTSVFRFRIGAHPYMLDNLRADPGGVSRKYQFEQHYVTHGIRGGIKFWPEEWTRHFRLHCLPEWPLRMFETARLPARAKIVTFPGGPNPEFAAIGCWGAGESPHSPWEHVRLAWARRRRKRGFFKELKSYLRPVPWIAENWRE